MRRQPTDDEIEDRLAGRALMERAAIRGDGIAGAAIALESIHPYMRTMLDYGEWDESDEY